MTIALTERCNLRCAHCFVHDASRDRELLATELSTEEWFRVFDQLADAGCLWLLLTGGEPLLRSDFAEIYRYVKQKGFVVTLFTNGTLLTPELVSLLQEWYPERVEISLYGASPGTYEKVTGVPGAYDRCRRGIEMLVEAGVPLNLKTVATTLTRDELEAMHQYAAELGVPFRHDGILWQTFDGADISGLRLSPSEVVALERRRPQWAAEFTRLYKRSEGKHSSGLRYTCGAALRTCHIGPDGTLYPCQMSRANGRNLMTASFEEAWEALGSVRQEQIALDFACQHCKLAGNLCQRCPAFSVLEHGEPDRVVEFLCDVAHKRAHWLGIEVP
ncbi:MAG: radical SAM protein [Candidatus Thorarchaeota archaeon]